LLVVDYLNPGLSAMPKSLDSALAVLVPGGRVVLKHGLQRGAGGVLPELLKQTRRHLRLNTDVRTLAALPDSHQKINRAIVGATLEAIEPAGYSLVQNRPG
jgi:hypothetical protein